MEKNDRDSGRGDRKGFLSICHSWMWAFRDRRPRTFAVVYAAVSVVVFVAMAPFAVAYDIVESVAVSSWRAFANQVRYERSIIAYYFRFCVRMTRDAWNRKPYGNPFKGDDAPKTDNYNDEEEAGHEVR